MSKFLSIFLSILLFTAKDAYANEECEVVIPELPEYQGVVALSDTSDPDLLVVYTQEAIDAIGGEDLLVDKIKSADEWRRAAYVNSAMTTSGGKLYIRKINHVESGSFSTELSDLRVNPEVLAIRDEVGADIVAMVIGTRNADNASVCGIGYLLTNMVPGWADYTFSVTHWSCMPSTFAHEIGHNMGCVHNPENTSSWGLLGTSFGHRHCENGGYRTIMSYQCTTPRVPRVPFYSNPDVAYDGKSTGLWSDDCSVKGACRDCAETIDTSAPFIAAFKERVVSSTTSTTSTTINTATTTTVISGPTTTISTPTTTLTPSTTTTTLEVCGDGTKQINEQCDGSDLGGCKYGCTLECQCVGGKPGWGRGGRNK